MTQGLTLESEKGHGDRIYRVVAGEPRIKKATPEGAARQRLAVAPPVGDIDGVRAAALRLSGDMIRNMTPEFWARPEWKLFVTDEAGETVLTLRFAAEKGSRFVSRSK